MDCTVTPLKTLMGFSVHLNVQLKFYNLPNKSENVKKQVNLMGLTCFLNNKYAFVELI